MVLRWLAEWELRYHRFNTSTLPSRGVLPLTRRTSGTEVRLKTNTICDTLCSLPVEWWRTRGALSYLRLIRSQHMPDYKVYKTYPSKIQCRRLLHMYHHFFKVAGRTVVIRICSAIARGARRVSFDAWSSLLKKRSGHLLLHTRTPGPVHRRTTSSLCAQLDCLQGRWRHFIRESSFPTQNTSPSHVLSVPFLTWLRRTLVTRSPHKQRPFRLSSNRHHRPSARHRHDKLPATPPNNPYRLTVLC